MSNMVGRSLSLAITTSFYAVSCQMFSALTPPQKSSIKSSILSLQTAWTSFDPNLYSGGSSSADHALVEIATARSFYTQQGPG